MSDHPQVAIFWDYENCSPPSNLCGLGYDIVNNITRIARLFGPVTTFRAYLDVSAQSPKSVALRSELQSSGVSIIDCPHNGKKDVVDKMILVDLLAFAIDHPAPATIILITGDRDYAYAVSILKLRKYQIILVVPSSPHISPCLESQASLVIDWGVAALRTRTEAVNSTQAVRQPHLDLDANIIIKLERELQELSVDGPDATPHPYSATSQGASRLRRMSVRDLLEPLRHSKNTGSTDSTQEYTLNPTSPRKSTSTANDSAPGGLPIPKTPSRSRRESISTGSTRARSAAMVAQSPPAVEQDVPAKNPSLDTARQSSISDNTDIACPTKHSLSVLPSLDVLELPLHDNQPPSSIILRSPLEPIQLTGDMPVSRKPTPCSDKLDCLASPFVMATAPTGLEFIPNPCSRQSRPTAVHTSSIVASTRIFTGVAATACEIPQWKDSEVPKEIEHLTGLSTDDNDGRSEWSISYRIHPQEGTRNATSYHSHVTSHATYTPSNSDVELHLTNTPSSKHVSPAAVLLGVGDDVDPAQFAAVTRASNTPNHPAPDPKSVSPSTVIPSAPFTATELHETDDSELRQTFKPLIHLLLEARERGIARPTRSIIAMDLVQLDKQVYQRAGVSRFREYTALAERAGIIELGGKEGGAWIALHPNWFGVDGLTTTHVPYSRLSPTSDPPKTIQSPLLTGAKNPLTEEAAVSQAPISASPKRRSFETGGTLPASPPDRQANASRASIPTQFQPLIDILIRMRAEGLQQVLRSLIGQLLRQDVYTQAQVSGFKEYVHQASEAQLVECGGVGGQGWIRIHPELRV